jgi:hypothetical protein
MWSSLHGILLQKLQSETWNVPPHVVREDDQFPIGSANLNSAPIREWSANLNYVIAGVEFEPFAENRDDVKAARIPNFDRHLLLRLTCLPFSFWNLCLPSKPDEFIVAIEVKP